MKVSTKRFAEEWKRFKKKNKYKSNAQAVDECKDIIVAETTISRFCNGGRELTKENIKSFSKIFGVREAYLAGVDDYRTEEDLRKAVQWNMSMSMAFHRILVNLGYSDFLMEEDDYNFTFPSNTKAFILKMEELLKGKEEVVLCNVEEDTAVVVSYDEMEQTVSEILDFIEFKLHCLFRNASEIPQMCDDNGKELRRPRLEVPTLDGNKVKFHMKYLPTAIITESTRDKFVSVEFEK